LKFVKGKLPLELLSANDKEKCLAFKTNALQIIGQLKVVFIKKKMEKNHSIYIFTSILKDKIRSAQGINHIFQRIQVFIYSIK